jgi:hypothetical protein
MRLDVLLDVLLEHPQAPEGRSTARTWTQARAPSRPPMYSACLMTGSARYEATCFGSTSSDGVPGVEPPGVPPAPPPGACPAGPAQPGAPVLTSPLTNPRSLSSSISQSDFSGHDQDVASIHPADCLRARLAHLLDVAEVDGPDAAWAWLDHQGIRWTWSS